MSEPPPEPLSMGHDDVKAQKTSHASFPGLVATPLMEVSDEDYDTSRGHEAAVAPFSQTPPPPSMAAMFGQGRTASVRYMTNPLSAATAQGIMIEVTLWRVSSCSGLGFLIPHFKFPSLPAKATLTGPLFNPPPSPPPSFLQADLLTAIIHLDRTGHVTGSSDLPMYQPNLVIGASAFDITGCHVGDLFPDMIRQPPDKLLLPGLGKAHDPSPRHQHRKAASSGIKGALKGWNAAAHWDGSP